MGRSFHKILVCSAVLALSAVSPAVAQHYIGIRGGWGGGMGRIEPKPDEQGTVWGLYHGGISWKYYSREKAVGGVQADLLFMQQGFRSYDLSDVPEGSTEKAERESYYQRTVNSITLPIYWQTHGYLFMRRMRVFLNLGVTLSYNFSSKEESHNYVHNETTGGTYDMRLERDNPLTYGLGGGAGIGWSFDRLEILFEGRYYFGYGDIYRNRNRYELNPLRSPLDNIQFSLGVYWRLGKNGIISPPSPKVAAKLREYEEARREKILEHNPQKFVRQWEQELVKSMRDEAEALDYDMKSRSADIKKRMDAYMNPWSDGGYFKISLESIPSFATSL